MGNQRGLLNVSDDHVYDGAHIILQQVKSCRSPTSQCTQGLGILKFGYTQGLSILKLGMVKLGILKSWVYSNLGMLIFGYTRGWVYSNLGTLKG